MGGLGGAILSNYSGIWFLGFTNTARREGLRPTVAILTGVSSVGPIAGVKHVMQELVPQPRVTKKMQARAKQEKPDRGPEMAKSSAVRRTGSARAADAQPETKQCQRPFSMAPAASVPDLWWVAPGLIGKLPAKWGPHGNPAVRVPHSILHFALCPFESETTVLQGHG